MCFIKHLQVLIFVSFCNLLAFGQAVPRFEPSDSTIIKLPQNEKIQFGYLVVLEDRTNPHGKTLRLPVFILKSRNPKPRPDPVLYTTGGPGGSSVNTAQYGAYFSYLDDRDFIVFEQRGTRFAQPSLSCPELDSIQRTNTWFAYTEEQKEALKVKAAMVCHSRLLAEGNILSSYNTKASAADIEDLRKVLGIQQFNLLSESYSTKIAQVLLRDYPASIRSAVLDSPLPLWVNYDETSVAYFSDKLNLLFSNCAADSACSAAYPKLKSRFLAFLEQANKMPVTFALKSPIDSALISVRVTGNQIASFINLGNTWGLAGLPKMMYQLCTGDYSALKPSLYALWQPSNYAMGMRLSVWCSEEYPFEKIKNGKKINNLSLPALATMKNTAVPLSICNIWKVNKTTDRENQPFSTDVPVLILNGEYDPDTPASWGIDMKRRFANSYHFIFRGMSHTPTQYWDNPCGMQMANAFFNQPTKQPVLECFTLLPKLKFATPKP